MTTPTIYEVVDGQRVYPRTIIWKDGKVAMKSGDLSALTKYPGSPKRVLARQRISEGKVIVSATYHDGAWTSVTLGKNEWAGMKTFFENILHWPEAEEI